MRRRCSRDADGIALGGVRTPPVDVPVRVPVGREGPERLGDLPAARLDDAHVGGTARRALPVAGDYEERYDAAVDEAIDAGFVLEEDREALARLRAPGARHRLTRRRARPAVGASMTVMFDTDAFIEDCVAARAELEPRRAIKEVLERALDRPGEVAEALRPERAELIPLHVSPDLTVQKVVWAPGMRIKPHDHRMWAMIGIYTGTEQNTFFRRTPDGLVQSGGKELGLRDLCLLGDDTVHSVSNPRREFTGAIHIYGGDIFSTERSQWDPETLEECPYDVAATLKMFEEANAPTT